jgi:hypothetical protein
VPELNLPGNAPGSAPALLTDEALLRRIQQENQREIIGKLMHDLRNPLHSIRIMMELFGRLARRKGNVDELLERAATYIEPAEKALAGLLANTERLGQYLANPVAPVMTPVGVSEWCQEIALLLRGSRRRLQVTVAETDPSLRMSADRVRLGHCVLLCCLVNESSQVDLSVRRQSDGRVCVELNFGARHAAANDTDRPRSLSVEELRELIGNAGGQLVTDEAAMLSFSFWEAAA